MLKILRDLNRLIIKEIKVIKKLWGEKKGSWLRKFTIILDFKKETIC